MTRRRSQRANRGNCSGSWRASRSLVLGACGFPAPGGGIHRLRAGPAGHGAGSNAVAGGHARIDRGFSCRLCGFTPGGRVGRAQHGRTCHQRMCRTGSRTSAGLVYLAANLVPSGQSIREAAGVDLDGVMTGVHISADGLSSTYEPETALTVFYNSTDRAEAEPCHRPANAAAPRTNQRAFIANQGTLRLGPPRLYRMSSGPRDPHRLSTQDAASTAVHACRGDGLRSLALLVPARRSFPTHHRHCELFSKQAGTARLRLGRRLISTEPQSH